MMLGALGVSSLDGSPVPLGSTATHETTGLKTLWIKRQSSPKQINISDSQQPSGDSGSRVAHQNNKKVSKATPG